MRTTDRPSRAKEASLVHRGLGRVEFFDLTGAELAGLEETLGSLAGEGRKRFSFHAPVTRPAYFPYSGVTCFFLCEDPARRALSFRVLEDTVSQAAAWGADYVVCHLTFGPTDTPDPATAATLARDSCARFAALSRAHAIPIDVEFAAYSDAFHRPAPFVEAVTAHGELGICLDIGHAYLGSLKRQRDYMADIATLAAAARSLHLWNTKGPEHCARHGHVPLHPSQRPEDGWIDVARVLEIACGEGAPLNVIFEYPVAKVTAEIAEGYEWVADIMARPRLGADGS